MTKKPTIEQITKLYNRTSLAMSKASALLEKASNMEQEIFGTTRGDIDLDAVIDTLEYSSGGGYVFTEEEVKNLWKEYIN